MRILRKNQLFYSVRTAVPVRRSFLQSFFCLHDLKTTFMMIDHTTGPGWMSDTYEGEVCVDCGRVTECERTY